MQPSPEQYTLRFDGHMDRPLQGESKRKTPDPIPRADWPKNQENILLGWVLWAIGLGLFSTLDDHSGLSKQIGYAILTGLGVGNTLQP